MKPLTEHIAVIRGKPEYIRKQIALGIAGALTAFIAFVWLTTSVATGAFAIRSTPLADDPQLAVTPESISGFGSLVGAVSAVFGGNDVAPRIEVVGADTGETPTPKKAGVAAEPTILPF